MILRDKHEASQFYRTYRPKLLSFVRSKIDNPQEAEDVVQDTLFAFLEAMRDFNGRCRVSTFLFSICHNKIVDYYRKKKIKQLVFSRVPYLEELLSPLVGPEESFDARQVQKKIQKTLAKLLPRYAYILRSRYDRNMSTREIANKLAVTVKSAEMLLFRARKAFIKSYET